LNLETAKSIAEVRKNGLDKQTLERISTGWNEQNRMTRRGYLGSLSPKQDKKTRKFLFTGQYQKVNKPATDFVTKQEIPGKMITRYRFQVYDGTDANSPNDPSIWERGFTEADQVLYWLSQGKAGLTIMEMVHLIRKKDLFYISCSLIDR